MAPEAPACATIRLDKWLWHARFFKSRSVAAKEVSLGHVRVNAQRMSKPARAVGPGDVLTFPQGKLIRVVEIIAPGTRRGPAPEAQALYKDLSPPPALEPTDAAAPKAGPRPSREERRSAAKLKGSALE